MKQKRLTQKLRAYRSVFRIRAAEGLQYRTAAFAGAATGIFWAIIEITVYTVFFTYSERAGLEGISGLTLRQAVTYAWIAQVLLLLQPMSIDPDILQKINTGDVGVELCRPMDLYTNWYLSTAAARLAPMIWRGGLTLLAGILLPGGYRISPPGSLPGLAVCILSAGCAVLLCTSYGMLVTAMRLNVPWGDGPCHILLLLSGLLSGCYLPLQLWPEPLQKILFLQPFAGYLDFPARLYLGTLAPQDALPALGLQLLWTAVFLLGGRALMRKCLSNIVIQGG